MGTKFLNIRYVLMQASYWGIFCSINGYAAVYLDGKGFTAGQTGTVLALANIIAAFLQPVAAAKADKQGRFSLKEITLTLGIVGIVSAILLCVPGLPFAALCLLFGLGSIAIQSLQPMVNAVSMYYLNRGERMNYGLARGFGSVTYALVSYLLGFLAGRVGILVIPVLAAGCYLLFLLITASFSLKQDAGKEESAAAGKPLTYPELLKRYRRFGVLLVGIAFMFIFHFMTNTYMFQMVQAVGGDSSHMGVAVCVAALSELPVMFLFGRIVKRIPAGKLLRFAAVLWAVKAVAFCFCTNVTAIYAVQLLQMVSYGLYIPASVYYANQLMEEENKVKGQALATMAFSVGSVFGSLLGGKLIDWYGVRAMLAAGAACTVIGAVLFFIGTAEESIKS
ncbi:MAG: MFS transporter [Eubacteriales bacterium]|nr:MFS transporter [Eubacteriales bacterium]